MTTLRDRVSMTPQERALSVLRDVLRSGGKDVWSHLHSHGHSYSTVRSLVARQLLLETSYCHYELSERGKRMADGGEG